MTEHRPVPVACSLDAAALAERQAEIDELVRLPSEGLRLHFRGSKSVRAAVHDIARREQECCPFFQFSFEEHHEDLLVGVAAPIDARPLLMGLFAPASE